MDQATFHAFFKDTAPALKGYLRLRCRNAAFADDLLQETYLRLLRRPPPTLGAAQLKSYLYKTASSVCADHYRARRQEAPWQEETSDDTAGADSDDTIGLADGSAPDSLELPLDMQRVFATLKPRQQSLLWLAYVEGFTHDEIAEVIGVNVGSVKVLLSRARALLAEKLNDLGFGTHSVHGVRR